MRFIEALVSQITALRPPLSEQAFFARYLGNVRAELDVLRLLEAELSRKPQVALKKGDRSALIAGYGRQLANIGRRQERLVAAKGELKDCSQWTP